jgi:hypothetical protein
VQCPYCTKIKFFFQHIENKNSFALRKAPFHGIITMIMRPLRRLLEELYKQDVAKLQCGYQNK